MGRNKMTTLLDDAEKKLFKIVKGKMQEPFMFFKELRYLDLSSNELRRFPDDFSHLGKLKELNLMNN